MKVTAYGHGLVKGIVAECKMLKCNDCGTKVTKIEQFSLVDCGYTAGRQKETDPRHIDVFSTVLRREHV